MLKMQFFMSPCFYIFGSRSYLLVWRNYGHHRKMGAASALKAGFFLSAIYEGIARDRASIAGSLSQNLEGFFYFLQFFEDFEFLHDLGSGADFHEKNCGYHEGPLPPGCIHI